MLALDLSSASLSPSPSLVLTFEISLRRNQSISRGSVVVFSSCSSWEPFTPFLSLPMSPVLLEIVTLSLDSLLVQLGHFCPSGFYLTPLAFQRDSTVFKCMTYGTCLPWVEISTSCVTLDQ